MGALAGVLAPAAAGPLDADLSVGAQVVAGTLRVAVRVAVGVPVFVAVAVSVGVGGAVVQIAVTARSIVQVGVAAVWVAGTAGREEDAGDGGCCDDKDDLSSHSMATILRRTSVMLAWVAMIAVNAAANAIPINGVNTGEVSDRFDIYFVPAGYVFSIWGVIYLGLLGYAVYQALPAQAANPRLRSIAGLFILSAAANIAWIFLWHYLLFPLTLVAMLVLLFSLIGIHLRLHRGDGPVTKGEQWLVRLPFSVYLGWVSVATIANVSQVLFYLDWNGFGISPEAWAVSLLIVGVILAGLMAFIERAPAYVAVFVWAYAGIGVAQAQEPSVAMTAWAGTLVLALLAILAVVLRLRSPSASDSR